MWYDYHVDKNMKMTYMNIMATKLYVLPHGIRKDCKNISWKGIGFTEWHDDTIIL